MLIEEKNDALLGTGGEVLSSEVFEKNLKEDSETGDFSDAPGGAEAEDAEDTVSFADLGLDEATLKAVEKKGFKDWIYSAFSNEQYLKNAIELIVKSLIKKMEYILILIIDQLKRYFEDIFHSIEKSISLSTIEFTNEQLSYWKEIKKFYEDIKGEITSLKNKLKSQNQ